MKTEFREFSFEKIEELTGNDQSAVKHFSELFISHTIGNDLPQLQSALSEGDVKTAGEIAHRMKASIDLFSIEEGSERIRSIEEGCAQLKAKETITQNLLVLQEILDRVKTQIEAALS